MLADRLEPIKREQHVTTGCPLQVLRQEMDECNAKQLMRECCITRACDCRERGCCSTRRMAPERMLVNPPAQFLMRECKQRMFMHQQLTALERMLDNPPMQTRSAAQDDVWQQRRPYFQFQHFGQLRRCCHKRPRGEHLLRSYISLCLVVQVPRLPHLLRICSCPVPLRIHQPSNQVPPLAFSSKCG